MRSSKSGYKFKNQECTDKSKDRSNFKKLKEAIYMDIKSIHELQLLCWLGNSRT